MIFYSERQSDWILGSEYSSSWLHHFPLMDLEKHSDSNILEQKYLSLQVNLFFLLSSKSLVFQESANEVRLGQMVFNWIFFNYFLHEADGYSSALKWAECLLFKETHLWVRGCCLLSGWTNKCPRGGGQDIIPSRDTYPAWLRIDFTIVCCREARKASWRVLLHYWPLDWGYFTDKS